VRTDVILAVALGVLLALVLFWVVKLLI